MKIGAVVGVFRCLGISDPLGPLHYNGKLPVPAGQARAIWLDVELPDFCDYDLRTRLASEVEKA